MELRTARRTGRPRGQEWKVVAVGVMDVPQGAVVGGLAGGGKAGMACQSVPQMAQWMENWMELPMAQRTVSPMELQTGR